MRRLGNTLYITTTGTALSKEGETIRVGRDGQAPVSLPIHGIDGIVAFGGVSLTPALLGFCAEQGVTVSWFTEYGRFLARAEGPVRGNVLLRRRQYRASDGGEAAEIARAMVIGKVHNQRHVLRRALRDAPAASAVEPLTAAIDRLDRCLGQLERGLALDQVRGVEGEAAQVYFAVFGHLLRQADFTFTRRVRRPPTDPVNALLSFVYALLTHDLRSAAEGVGLDSAVGFLHRDRPGRPSLALDLIEEFRPWFADRLVLSLINRRQIALDGFEQMAGGATHLTEAARRTLLTAYQERKREIVAHPFTGEKLMIGLIFHEQARLLAAHLRGDLDAYPVFLAR